MNSSMSCVNIYWYFMFLYLYDYDAIYSFKRDWQDSNNTASIILLHSLDDIPPILSVHIYVTIESGSYFLCNPAFYRIEPDNIMLHSSHNPLKNYNSLQYKQMIACVCPLKHINNTWIICKIMWIERST